MFVYLLIAAELALLYTVYWYLHVREPKHARRIGGNTWGNYGNLRVTAYGAGCKACCTIKLPISADSLSYSVSERDEYDRRQELKPFMVPDWNEMSLDLKTNRYVPIESHTMSCRVGSRFVRLVQIADDFLSEINVRP